MTTITNVEQLIQVSSMEQMQYWSGLHKRTDAEDDEQTYTAPSPSPLESDITFIKNSMAHMQDQLNSHIELNKKIRRGMIMRGLSTDKSVHTIGLLQEEIAQKNAQLDEALKDIKILLEYLKKLHPGDIGEIVHVLGTKDLVKKIKKHKHKKQQLKDRLEIESVIPTVVEHDEEPKEEEKEDTTEVVEDEKEEVEDEVEKEEEEDEVEKEEEDEVEKEEEDEVVQDEVVQDEVEEEEEEDEVEKEEDQVVQDEKKDDEPKEDVVEEEEDNQVELVIHEVSEEEVCTDDDEAKEEEEEDANAEEEEEEDAEEEVFEIEIDDVTYFATNEENGILYAVNADGDIGDKVGIIRDGEPIFT